MGLCLRFAPLLILWVAAIAVAEDSVPPPSGRDCIVPSLAEVTRAATPPSSVIDRTNAARAGRHQGLRPSIEVPRRIDSSRPGERTGTAVAENSPQREAILPETTPRAGSGRRWFDTPPASDTTFWQNLRRLLTPRDTRVLPGAALVVAPPLQPHAHRAFSPEALTQLQAARRAEDHWRVAAILRAHGRNESATAALRRLEQRLRSYGPRDIAWYGPMAQGGITDTIRVTFADGREGVFKPDLRYQTASHNEVANAVNPRAEVAFYRGDQLFDGDLVPPTIPFELNGRTGSLQMMISPTSAPERGVPVPARMRLLDYLFANSDRHYGNWLVDAQNRPIAIDHGLAFQEGPADNVLARTEYFNWARAELDRFRETGATDAQYNDARAAAFSYFHDLTLRPVSEWGTLSYERNGFRTWAPGTTFRFNMSAEVVGRFQATRRQTIREIVPDLETFERLKALTPDVIHRQFEGVLSSAEMLAIADRVQTLIREVRTQPPVPAWARETR